MRACVRACVRASDFWRCNMCAVGWCIWYLVESWSEEGVIGPCVGWPFLMARARVCVCVRARVAWCIFLLPGLFRGCSVACSAHTQTCHAIVPPCCPRTDRQEPYHATTP